MASEHERRLTEYEGQVDQLQETIKGSRGGGRRPATPPPGRARSGSARSRSGCSRRRASSPRPSPRTRSCPPPCVRRASTSPRCARRSRSSRCRRRGTARTSAPTTTAPSTSSPRAARCASAPPRDRRRRARAAARKSCSTSRSTSCSPAAADVAGEVVTFKELLEDGTRALVVGRADEERVLRARRRAPSDVKLRAGDHLLMEGRSGSRAIARASSARTTGGRVLVPLRGACSGCEASSLEAALSRICLSCE